MIESECHPFISQLCVAHETAQLIRIWRLQCVGRVQLTTEVKGDVTLLQSTFLALVDDIKIANTTLVIENERI